MRNLEHPLYGRKQIRAVFAPKDDEQSPIWELNPAAKQMVGKEFLWDYVGMFGSEGVYTLANFEDFATYWETTPRTATRQLPDIENKVPGPILKGIWILERDLENIKIENLDG